MAQRRMHVIGKIHRRGAHRQLDHPSLGRHRKDHGIIGRTGLLTRNPLALVMLPGQQLPQPRDARLPIQRWHHHLAAPGCTLFLVAPVRRQPVLGRLVHRPRADLHLHRPAIVSHHDRMQRLVAIGLRIGDVVVQLIHLRHPALMHQVQRRIAVGQCLHHHPQRPQVMQLLQAQMLGPQFVVDAVQMLRAPLHLRLDAVLGQQRRQLGRRIGHEGIPLRTFAVQRPRQLPVPRRLQATERQILHLPLDAVEPQTVGQRCQHLHRLLRQPPHVGVRHRSHRHARLNKPLGQRRALALGVIPGPPVCRHMAQRLQGRRQPHHHHPHVPCHGQRHAAQHLRLRLPRRPLTADQGRERQGHQTLAVGQQRTQIGAQLLTQLHIQFRLVRPGIAAHQQPEHPGDRVRPLQLQDRRQPAPVLQPRLTQRAVAAHPPGPLAVRRQPVEGPGQHLLRSAQDRRRHGRALRRIALPPCFLSCHHDPLIQHFQRMLRHHTGNPTTSAPPRESPRRGLHPARR